MSYLEINLDGLKCAFYRNYSGGGVGEGAVMLITFINNTIACALFFKIVLRSGKKLLSHVAPEDTETH